MRLTPLETLLCRLADPEKPGEAVPAAQLQPLLQLAVVHGVTPIVVRKLADQLPEPALRSMREELTNRVGPMLHLRAISAKVGALVAEGLPAAVIKGPELAEAAYPMRADRPFTDLDILAAPEAYQPLADLLQGLGYRMFRKPVLDHTESNQEQKWVHPQVPSALVEVHGNLVHYAALRRRVSFGYDELMRCRAVSPALARLFTVIVHAILGHKLHQLKLLVDALQTFRRLDAREREALPKAAADLRLTLEVALCLDLVDQLFDVPAARDVARRLDGRRRPFRSLISAGSVLAFPRSRGAVARHHLFRAFQYAVAR